MKDVFKKKLEILFFFCLWFNIPVNIYGHVETVS